MVVPGVVRKQKTWGSSLCVTTSTLKGHRSQEWYQSQKSKGRQASGLHASDVSSYPQSRVPARYGREGRVWVPPRRDYRPRGGRGRTTTMGC